MTRPISTALAKTIIDVQSIGHQVSECRRCGHVIVTNGEIHGKPHWTHLMSYVTMTVGCRAASYDRDGTWDDAYPRAWSAAPLLGPDRRPVPFEAELD